LQEVYLNFKDQMRSPGKASFGFEAARHCLTGWKSGLPSDGRQGDQRDQASEMRNRGGGRDTKTQRSASARPIA